MAPELIREVPLHSGHCTERRLKKAINQLTPLNERPPTITSVAWSLDTMKHDTSAVAVVISAK